jgi:hypothetical protein
MDAAAALKRSVGQLLVMVVSKDKKQGLVQAGNNKFQVIKRQISGAKYYIHIGETVFYRVCINKRVYLVGNAENFHILEYFASPGREPKTMFSFFTDNDFPIMIIG